MTIPGNNWTYRPTEKVTAMTDDEPPSPLPAGGWEIDWESLAQTAHDADTAHLTSLDAQYEAIPWEEQEWIRETFRQIARAVVREYQSQQAAQGVIEVLADDLDFYISRMPPAQNREEMDVERRLCYALAAAKDQAQ